MNLDLVKTIKQMGCIKEENVSNGGAHEPTSDSKWMMAHIALGNDSDEPTGRAWLSVQSQNLTVTQALYGP